MLYLILVQTGEEEIDFVISEQDVSVVNQVSFEIKTNIFRVFTIVHASVHKKQMKCILRPGLLLLFSVILVSVIL